MSRAMSENLVHRIADIELRELVEKDRGYSAVLFFDYLSISCDHFRPEFQAFAREMRLIFCGELVCDENPTITGEMGVSAIPTTLLFKAGKELGRWEGPYSREALKERAVEAIKNSKKLS
jgi:thioredoxin-like negative regulator of GroEL